MLSAAQMVRMSRLLDEALELDLEGRRRWLEALSPDCQDLEPALRHALLAPSDSAADSNDSAALPSLRSVGGEPDFKSGFEAGERVGPYRLIRRWVQAAWPRCGWRSAPTGPSSGRWR